MFCGSLWCSKVSSVRATSENPTKDMQFTTFNGEDMICMNVIPDYERGQYPLNGTSCGTNKVH